MGGEKFECPAGSLGEAGGQWNPTCDGQCPRGYYCVGGEKHECGSVDKYCPAGSSAPTNVTTGHYSGPSDVNENVRYEETLCPVGYYCVGGEKFECASGYFGNSTGLTTSQCSGMCKDGYYCESGSTRDDQHECGSVDKYCPAGSETPLVVPDGYYSGPEDASETTRSEKTICPAGYYCVGGEKFECGSVDKYCPAGSSTPTSVPADSCSGPLSSSESIRYSVFSPDAYHVCVGARFHLPFSLIRSLYMRIHFTDSSSRRLCSSGSMTVVNEYPNPNYILDDFVIASNFTERVVDVSSPAVGYSNGTLSFLISPESISEVALPPSLHR